jgi:hypothetical protein
MSAKLDKFDRRLIMIYAVMTLFWLFLVYGVWMFFRRRQGLSVDKIETYLVAVILVLAVLYAVFS